MLASMVQGGHLSSLLARNAPGVFHGRRVDSLGSAARQRLLQITSAVDLSGAPIEKSSSSTSLVRKGPNFLWSCGLSSRTWLLTDFRQGSAASLSRPIWLLAARSSAVELLALVQHQTATHRLRSLRSSESKSSST